MMLQKTRFCLLNIWLLCFTLLYSFKVSAQNNCPFIWPIEGSTCIDCAPDNWETILTADIVDGFNYTACAITGGGTSPSGGNSVLLYGTGNNAEGIETTIGGLVPGEVYNIGFYWTEAYLSCGLLPYGGGNLSLVIDGLDYEFTGADDWELAEICFMASSSIAELTLSIISSEPGVILIDDAICADMETCCDLEIDVNSDVVVCPGDVLVFDAEYSMEQGAVTLEWTSFPEDGVDYLDDPYTLNPTFSIPEGVEFLGETYQFTLTVMDGACEKMEDFILFATPWIIPEFDFTLCEVFGEFELPTSSLEPYTGNWEGDFDFSSLGGTFQEYTFLLDPDQNNCLESHVYEYYISEAEPVTFDLPLSYCGLDRETYFLEFTSDDGVEGVWESDAISPDELTPDFYTLIFTPDPNLHCAYNYEYNFEIRMPDSLSFNIPSTFCIVQDNYILPTVSLEGIQGVWDVIEIDVSTVGTNYQVIFTPEDVEDCYYSYVHTYEVTTSIQNSFSMPLSICSIEGEYEFPTFSEQGYEGTWSPSLVNFDTLTSNVITSSWQPNPGQSDCLIPSSQSINIEQAELLNFDLFSEVCRMSPSFVLPTANFENTITGQWNMPIVNPNLLDIGDNVFEFVADDIYCAEVFNYTLAVTEEFQPIFNMVTGFCPSQSAVTLPTISDDGYSGTWTVPVIDPSTPGIVSIESTFVPDQGQANCLVNYVEIFTVDLLIDPLFDLPESICSDELPFSLPSISDNNVNGQWSIQTLDNTITDQVVTLIYTPDDLSCYNILNTSLEIIQLDVISINFENVSDCGAADGSITINNSILAFEYSIDNGVTWQTTNTFENLNENTYEVIARDQDLPSCFKMFNISIEGPERIQFTTIEVENITNCTTDDGLIIANTNLASVEYSIDDGITWQTNNSFENLSSGTYTILARNTLGQSCQDTIVSSIEDYPETQILMIDSENVTECEVDNGVIEVLLANGQDLEFSLNGLDWQSQNRFENVGIGNYNLYARSYMSPDCIDSISVELVGPEMPMILNVTSEDTKDCDARDGLLEIDAFGINLEYSIDDGLSWQDVSLFEMLSEGVYVIVIREKGTTTCIDKSEITIFDPEPFVLNSIEVDNVTSCFPSIGSINIFASSIYNLEYSIDGGITWQFESEFENLESGEFEVTIRPIDFISCQQSDNVNIELVLQEIEILEVKLNQPSDCVSTDASIEIITDLNGLEFSIDNGASWQTNSIFSSMPDGQYTVIIRKPNTTDCEENYTFEILTPPCPCNNLDVEVEINHVTCESANSGSLEIINIDGAYTNDDISILWSNEVEGDFNDLLTSGWYTYILEYDKNCQWIDSVYIENFDPITFGLLSFDKTCTDEGQIEVVNFMGGNGEFNFSVDEAFFQEESVFYNLSPAQYSVFVMDQMGCQEEEGITLNTSLDLSLELDGIDPIVIDESTFLNPLINQGTVDSFEWYPEIGVLNPGELVANVAPRETTEYTLTVYYGDCVEIRSILVEVIDNRKFFTPNIFSLSDDNNNIFFLQGADDLGVAIHNFNIYDRWGNLVFAKENVPLNDRSFGWDGYFNGRESNIGVYTYYINYTLRGDSYKEAGTLTLIR